MNEEVTSLPFGMEMELILVIDMGGFECKIEMRITEMEAAVDLTSAARMIRNLSGDPDGDQPIATPEVVFDAVADRYGIDHHPDTAWGGYASPWATVGRTAAQGKVKR